MAQVVFLRGVNVGGHKRFQPSVVARGLVDLAVTNLGAAGTFVVRESIGQTALRARFRQQLGFDVETFICPARDIARLISDAERLEFPDDSDTRLFVSIMAKSPRTALRLPVCRPAGDTWEVKVVAVSGRFAISVWRRRGKSILYPNEVVEKQFGVPATTRNWNTVVAIAQVLAGS
jgi:uncharacterized protein (DUF1697 family)